MKPLVLNLQLLQLAADRCMSTIDDRNMINLLHHRRLVRARRSSTAVRKLTALATALEELRAEIAVF